MQVPIVNYQVTPSTLLEPCLVFGIPEEAYLVILNQRCLATEAGDKCFVIILSDESVSPFVTLPSPKSDLYFQHF